MGAEHTDAPTSGSLDPIEHTLARVRRRVRLQRALGGGCAFAIAAMAIAGLAVCLLKAGMAEQARGWFALAAALPPIGAVIGAARRVPRLLVARLCDGESGGHDLLASAASFLGLPREQRTPFMNACIERARARAREIDPRKVFAPRAPRGLLELFGLGGGVALLFVLEIPTLVPQPPPAGAVSRLLHQEDLAAFEQELTASEASLREDPTLRRAIDRLNQMLEQLGDGELERLQVLAELRRLEKQLEAEPGEDRAALEQALRELGRALGRDSAIKPVAEALDAGDPAAASQALRKLSDELELAAAREAARRRLERALRRGAKDPARELSEELERRREEMRRLLKKRDQGGAESKREKRLLKRKRRELDKLRREHDKRRAQERELEKLRRNLDDAAGQLAQQDSQRSTGRASEQLRKAAQELQKLQQRKMSKQEREELRRKLSQLRQLISKQRQAGQQGQRGQGSQRAGGGSSSQRLSLGRFGRNAAGKPGQAGGAQQPGKPGGGKGRGDKGEDGEQTMLLQPGSGKGDKLLLLDSERQAAGEPEVPVSVSDGRQAGTSGQPESEQEPTQIDARHVDSRIAGQKGAGPTRSEVIRDASSRGFASRDYERVHTDYRKHAESVIERDEIPGGYRFYIRRYFQLIRPREETR